MLSCNYCPRVFQDRWRRSQHISQSPSCRTKYQKELTQRIKRYKPWHIDDPEELPESEGGHQLQAEEEGLDTIEVEKNHTMRDEVQHVPIQPEPLFEGYLAAITGRSEANQKNTPCNRQSSSTTHDLPIHAVPQVIDYHPTKNAGQPIRTHTIISPQDQVTGRLANDANFQMADFINSLDMSSRERETFFKLELNQNLPWKNDKQFMADMKALPKEPEMKPYKVVVGTGDDAEVVEYRSRNILEVLARLVGDPRFKRRISYIPKRVYADKSRRVRIRNEVCTADWMWRMQCMIEDEFATVLSVMLASDKTHLTTAPGGKEAWPVYVTIGNIDKEIRRQPSKRAMTLLGYLPVPKDLCEEPDKDRRSQRAWEIFHACMADMLGPLKRASEDGIELVCGDGGVRRCYPILAAYIADHPEQCLVACTTRCPQCEEQTENMGDLGEPARKRLKRTMMRALEDYEAGDKSTATQLGLRPVWPFWKDLPNVNLTCSMTPDLLHQLHKGMFLDHLVPWCSDLMGDQEIDRRFKAMTRYRGLRHFTNGITSVSHWTGREAREMSKVFLAVIDGKLTSKATEAARCLIDFMFIAHSSSITDVELIEMNNLLNRFHQLKHVFERKKDGKTRTFHLIRKLHMLRHYTEMIREFGTPDGTNSEVPERLHIDLAKDPYRASNKVDPLEQMATFVGLKEAIARRRHHLRESGRVHLAMKYSRTETDDDLSDGEDDDAGMDCRQVGLVDVVDLSQKFYPEPQLVVSKRSTWPHKTVTCLANTHGAVEFVTATNRFLCQLPLHPNVRCPTVNDTCYFPCWSQATLKHTRLSFKPTEPAKTDVVRASPETQSRPAFFDTVLLLAYPDKAGLSRYRAARIRVIFELPVQLRHLYEQKLVYVELFEPFTANRSSPSIFSTSRSYIHGQLEVAVIPLAAVRMTCQLTPVFGTLNNTAYTSKTDPLDTWQQFRFNSHADYFVFELLRHWCH